METTAAKTMSFYFKCHAIAVVIISIKVVPIYGVTIKTAQIIGYTILNNYILAIWVGMPCMMLHMLYNYLMEKYKK